jgi:hypothetical protein
MRTSSTLALFRRDETRGVRRRRFAPRLKVLAAAAVVVASLAILFASQPPGVAIHNDLTAAASVTALLPMKTEPEAVVQALHAVFPGRVITVDAEAFPAVVYVTLRALDKESCAGAVGSSRRMEGLVVVELERYRAAADCRDSNDMTWRIMP